MRFLASLVRWLPSAQTQGIEVSNLAMKLNCNDKPAYSAAFDSILECKLAEYGALRPFFCRYSNTYTIISKLYNATLTRTLEWDASQFWSRTVLIYTCGSLKPAKTPTRSSMSILSL